MIFQWASIDSIIILLLIVVCFLWTVTTTSRPFKMSLWWRKLSRIALFIWFLLTALLTFFFEIASPSLACFRLFFLASTRNFSSFERQEDLKTCRYSPTPLILFDFAKLPVFMDANTFLALRVRLKAYFGLLRGAP